MALIFAETTAQLAAAGVYTGPARDAGLAAPDATRFGATVNSDQAGTLYLEGSSNGSTNWRQQGSQAVSANVPIDLSVPIRYRFYRARYVNGGVQVGSGNFEIASSFS